MRVFVRDDATQATASLTISSQASHEQIISLALAKLNLPSNLSADLVLQGKPFRICGDLQEAGVSPLTTLSLVRTTLPGGVSINADDEDDVYQRMSTRRRKATFTVNERE